MTKILFITAIALSACAAYYSVMGLLAIFAAAVIPIFIMGSLLEAAKLVVASWLYRSWKEIPILMKSYFTSALVILMILTSMGIFGYLSKAHLDQAVPTGDVMSKVSILDEKIKTEKENIDVARKQIKQLDEQVDQTIGRSADSQGVERSLQIRRGQQKERATLLAEIGSAQTRLARLNEERAPIAAEARKVEAEVGPIKYIAALIYDDAAGEDVLEKAVRWVIIMIVLVFDPLAVLLLVAANWQMKREQQDLAMKVFAGNPEIKPAPEPLPEESKSIISNFFRKPKEDTSTLEVFEHATTKKVINLENEAVVDDQIQIDLIQEKPPRKPLR